MRMNRYQTEDAPNLDSGHVMGALCFAITFMGRVITRGYRLVLA